MMDGSFRVKRKGVVCRKLRTVYLKEADSSTIPPFDATAGFAEWNARSTQALVTSSNISNTNACANYTANNRVRSFTAFY